MEKLDHGPLCVCPACNLAFATRLRGNAHRYRTEQSLYIMRASNGYLKIGITGDLRARLSNMQMHSPLPIELVFAQVFPRKTCSEIERYLHWKLQPYHKHGEWFDVELDKVTELLQGSHALDA